MESRSDRNSNYKASSSRPPPDEEVNVNFKVKKTISLKLKKSETIRNVKAMLHEKEGVHETLQQLFFAGDELRDGQTIADYGIMNDSNIKLILHNLCLVKLHIIVLPNQKKFAVEAKNSDTIQHVKYMIQAMERIQPNDYTLYHDGKVVEDFRTLASFNVQSELVLHIVPNPRDALWISVTAPKTKKKKLEVKFLHTIRDVKKIAEAMMNLSTGNWQLFHGNTLLEDSKTLACYEIKENSMFNMCPVTYQIFVKTWTGKTIVLDVNHLNTIQDVKHKISLRTEVPSMNQWLVRGGRVLMDDWQNLASYHIQKESTVFANVRS